MPLRRDVVLCLSLPLFGCGATPDPDAARGDTESSLQGSGGQGESAGQAGGSGAAGPESGGALGAGSTLGTGGSGVGGETPGGGTGGTAGSGGTGLDGVGGSQSVDSVCAETVSRNLAPFGCDLAWGANGNEGDRASYLDFITTWIGYEHFQGRSGACDGCSLATALAGTGTMAVYYAYFAGYALDDCNVNPNGPNLCTDGAKWLRDNRALYLSLYAEYAAMTYAASPNQPVAWLLEGDFIQYTYQEQKEAFTMAELGDLAQEVVCTIKANAPNALVAMNHSTWISNEQAREFWAEMPTEIMDFAWTTGVGNNVGFIEESGSAGSYNGATARYDALHALSGLGLFVDTSFGLSQMGDSWSSQPADVLNARAAEGVMAINVTEPPSDYSSRLNAVRPNLEGTCP